VSKLLSICIILLCTVSCIEPFHPEIKETQDMLVINGRLTDQPGMQFVDVSRASPFNEPAFIPVEGCIVRVEDKNGQGVYYHESLPGVYRADLDVPFLGVNKAYKLFVRTPNGQEYQSEYDSMFACPPIDSLYYQIETRETENPDVTYQGLQFYLDVKGKEGDTRNFLWRLEETFEYRTRYPIQYFWDGRRVQEYNLPPYSLSRCYMTNSIAKIYTASSRYLTTNELNGYPLNFVSEGTPKLLRKYSLMVIQYSLSDDAFLYWEKFKTLTSETGGLYEKQPASLGGNIYNVNDPEEQIHGFFYTSQEHERWIILKNTFGFYTRDYYCPIDTVDDVDFLHMEVGTYMISLEPEEGVGPPYGSADQACFDCRLRGGSLEPPDYWMIDE